MVLYVLFLFGQLQIWFPPCYTVQNVWPLRHCVCTVLFWRKWRRDKDEMIVYSNFINLSFCQRGKFTLNMKKINLYCCVCVLSVSWWKLFVLCLTALLIVFIVITICCCCCECCACYRCCTSPCRWCRRKKDYNRVWILFYQTHFNPAVTHCIAGSFSFLFISGSKTHKK